MSTIAYETFGLDDRPRHSEIIPGVKLGLRCPSCRVQLEFSTIGHFSKGLGCQECGFEFTSKFGIWRALAPSGRDKFKDFVKDYELVRSKEGRGAGGLRYFLALPYKDVTRIHSWQWKIRGRSFRYLQQRILPSIEKHYTAAMDILDTGAGNCWMSYRLALRGHRPVAVDLVDNDRDGLGAARHYLSFLRRKFPRFQAEMDCLPFSDSQFDVVVFNASFHYSEDYRRTLQEALRCLRRPGHILVLDSPFYTNEANGYAMVREKHKSFSRKFGTSAGSIISREFLTRELLMDHGNTLGICWKFFEPWYGIGWALRPWRARLFRRREPSRFLIAWGRVE